MKKTTAKPWGERYIEEHGFDVMFAEENGVIVGLDTVSFPRFHPLTKSKLDAGRTRHRVPLTANNGKPQKFSQRRNADTTPYFPRCLNWPVIFDDTTCPIVITESESSALAAAARKIPAIGLGGCEGAFLTGTRRQKLHPVFEGMKLRRRRVYLVFDADGTSNANVHDAENALARLLTEAGADVRTVRLPAVTPDGKSSLCDLLAKDHGSEWFGALCDAAPKWAESQSAGPEPVVRCLHGVESRLPDYIWPGRIARGELTMISGDPGSAKTFILLSVAADLSRGRAPVTGEKCKPLRILYCTTENSPEHVIAPRFRAMGGDPRNLFLLESPVTLADVSPLVQAVLRYKIDLIVLDPIQSFFGEGADSHKATEVRPRMDALMRLAASRNVGVAIVRHLSKATSGRAIHRGMGSIDFTAAVRIELMAGHRADSPNDRAVVSVKNNLGQFAPALGFCIEGSGLNAKLRWTGETDMKLADLTAPEGVDRRAKTKIAQAEGYLRALLSRGPVKAADLAAEGVFDARTLQRAAERLGVERKGSKKESDVVWMQRKFERGYAANGAGTAKNVEVN